MTDPPFLNFWASRMLKNEHWCPWTMDLYPDAFVANNLISRKNFFFDVYQKTLKESPPLFIIALGKNQGEYIRRLYYPNVDFVHFPIGLQENNSDHEVRSKPIWSSAETLIFAYIGTLGEAHDEVLLSFIIKEVINRDYSFVLSCKGSKSIEILNKYKNSPGVYIVENVSKEQFKWVDIHIVTLLPSWTHIAVPSKALSAIESYATVLYLGSQESDTWQYISSASWIANDENEIKNFLDNICKKDVEIKKMKSRQLAIELKKNKLRGFEQVRDKLLITVK